MLEIQKIIKDFKKEIIGIYGKRLVNIILFGSWAKGKGTPDSDIDLLVVLDGEIIPGKEIDIMIDCITDLNLKYDTLISVVPVSNETFQETNSPLILNIKKEGIPA